ncbi:hypothetical protein ACLZHR_13810 [Priestia aryabhattai]|uniref:Uncharacterized protein n=1 Tax=Priestia megaterium Q3 TaxID=1452722 RepID=A0A806THV7_PRIMG|nr:MULTISPECIES: hypothetical protein [Priestia]AKP77801.1 hypothetical protein AS52_02840 [Priestia megaterium Q3]MCL9635052.1 hypothetical protein [Bacillus zanthoxyli]MED3992593.1 hypothetical protein [Priestia aryabhattai]NHH92981.1 hypothetical protein [Bacillus sp. MB95]
MISIGESFKLFLETLKHSNSNVLTLSDDLMEYYLLEEFAIEAPAYLSEFTLDRLASEGIIDEEIFEKSKKLKDVYFSMNQMKVWDSSSIKKSSEWKEIFSLSDQICELINKKWIGKEIEYLKTI